MIVKSLTHTKFNINTGTAEEGVSIGQIHLTIRATLTYPPLCQVASSCVVLSLSFEWWLCSFTASLYQRGRNPILSSPFRTSSVPDLSSKATSAPFPGKNLTLQTRSSEGFFDSAGKCSSHLSIVVLRKETNLAPHTKQWFGFQLPCLPRTSRGIWIVSNFWTVVNRPAGVLNPTIIF